MLPFIIHNIRHGFATNSSSSHSIILWDGSHLHDDGYYGQSFGWENFALTTKEEKLEYLAQLVYNQTGDEELVLELTDVVIDTNGCVDHQSIFSFPIDAVGNFNKKFFIDFRDAICSDKYAILGGSDNDGDHPDEDRFLQISIPFSSSNIAKWNEKGKFWTLFDKYNGTKIRLSFINNDHLACFAEKSDVPELVDVKITDYCKEGCTFCYQNSTTRGKHATLEYIKNVIDSLSELNTFEIAFGGGEPTEHPDFKEIIEYTCKKDIKPSFSTRNLEWVKENKEFLKNKIGGIGYSIGGSYHSYLQDDDLKDIISLRDFGINMQIQIADGTCSGFELVSMFQKFTIHKIPVLILGFKEVGRGKKYLQDFKPKSNLDVVLDKFFITDNSYEGYFGPVISFDTALVNKMEKWLNGHKVNKKYWTNCEGAHSMYINCVEEKMGESSFCENYTKIDNKNMTKNIKKFFSGLKK